MLTSDSGSKFTLVADGSSGYCFVRSVATGNDMVVFSALTNEGTRMIYHPSSPGILIGGNHKWRIDLASSASGKQDTLISRIRYVQ